MNPEQRASLLAVKLRALITDRAAIDPGWSVHPEQLQPVTFLAGSGLVHAAGATMWLLVEPSSAGRDPMDTDPSAQPRPPRGWLGGAMVLARRHGCSQVHLLGDRLNASDARRAALSATPMDVWSVRGRVITRVDAVPYCPAALPTASAMAFEDMIMAAGAQAVVEHGVLRAEVDGLEVARVLTDPDNGDAVLHVGVGRHDRLAQAMMNEGQDPAVALRHTVDTVRRLRQPQAGSHPANQLAVSRWLRQVVAQRPQLVGMASLTPVPGTEEPELKRLGPGLLYGDSTVVACSVGVDLDAAVDAVDTAVYLGADRVLLCIPPSSDLTAVRAAAASLVMSVEVLVVPADWADRADLVA